MAGRVAKAEIMVSQGVEVSILADGLVSAKGKMGSMSLQLHPKIKLVKTENLLTVSFDEKDREAYVLSGTMRALVANMVKGVEQGFAVELEMRGVGYRAAISGNALNLSVGFSHPVLMDIPEGIKIEVPAQTQIIVKGVDKQKVTQFAANIRRNRPPEPYKGKGIRYKDEVIIMKEGKKK